MYAKEKENFERIRSAIEFIDDNSTEQPSLDRIASSLALSPAHFQRMFTDWAGVSPKKFLQHISIVKAKEVLVSSHSTLFDAAFEVGLSGTGRLHDLFVSIEGMTPGEFRSGGLGLNINYEYHDTPYGSTLIASTPKGICYMAFEDGRRDTLGELEQLFPAAHYTRTSDDRQREALSVFRDGGDPAIVRLHIKGTAFQLKVWEALLRIPSGTVTTYGHLALHLNNPAASRAVGSAVGANPVSYIIPCHRVILSSGAFGNYHWDPLRKKAILGRELSAVGTYEPELF